MQILEAFRALNALNEDVFSLDADGIKGLSDFKGEDDFEDDISIIDPEAETEGDLQANYIGKVILDCCVCHSKIYKAKEEVTIDESGELANVGEECPYCYTPDGFKVIGEVAAFEGSSEEAPAEGDDNDEASGNLEEAYNNMRNYEDPEGRPQPKIGADDRFYVTSFIGGTEGTKVIAKGLSATEASRIAKRADAASTYKHNPNSGYRWEPKDTERWVAPGVRESLGEGIFGFGKKKSRAASEDDVFYDAMSCSSNCPEEDEDDVFHDVMRKPTPASRRVGPDYSGPMKRFSTEPMNESALLEGALSDMVKKAATRVGADAATILRCFGELIGGKADDITTHIENKAALKALQSGNKSVMSGLTQEDIEELVQDIADYENKKSGNSDELEEGIFGFGKKKKSSSAGSSKESDPRKGSRYVLVTCDSSGRPKTIDTSGWALDDRSWAERLARDNDPYMKNGEKQRVMTVAEAEKAFHKDLTSLIRESVDKSVNEGIFDKFKKNKDNTMYDVWCSFKGDIWKAVDEVDAKTADKEVKDAYEYNENAKGFKSWKEPHTDGSDYKGNAVNEGIFDRFKKKKPSGNDPAPAQEEPANEEPEQGEEDAFTTYSYDEWIRAVETAHHCYVDGPESGRMQTWDKVMDFSACPNLCKDVIAYMDGYMKHRGPKGSFNHKSYAKHLEEGIFGFGKKKKSSGGNSAKDDPRKRSQYVLVLCDKSGKPLKLDHGGRALDDWSWANQLARDNDPYMKNGERQKVMTVADAEKAFHKDLTNILSESIDDLSMTANDTHIEVGEDESGKVTVTMEPVTADGGEMIAPVSDETEAELMGEEDVPADGEEAPAEGEDVDMPVEEVDEESIDGLGESFLRKVYRNVESFKTSSVKQRGNSLIIEGAIKFTTGNTKRTSFIFEALDATKSGKVRFIGKNRQLAEGKKAFTLTGRMKGNKLIAESLNYNYTHRDKDGKLSRVYGTERASRRR